MTAATWWRDQGDLDEDQKNLIRLPIDEDFLIVGPPGCGKTNILVLRGTYLARLQKPNILLLSFTRTLKEFIAAGTRSRYHLPGDAVQTFMSWSTQFLIDAGVPRDVIASADGQEFAVMRKHKVDLLLQALDEGIYSRRHYDAILLDEIQDFWAAEIEVLRRLTRCLFVAGDARQRIYERNEGISKAEEVGCTRQSLTKHYRNGHAICSVADRISPCEPGQSMLDHSQYREADDPSSADPYHAEDLSGQFAIMARHLREQIRLYRGEYIGILCPKREIRDHIWGLIQDEDDLRDHAILQTYADGYQKFDPSRPICVMTIHAAKGLEFKGVHIPMAEQLRERNLAFTAVTRAKTSLAVYHSRPLRSWLSGAFPTRVEREPALEDLF